MTTASEASASTSKDETAASVVNGSVEDGEMAQYKKKAQTAVSFRIVYDPEDLDSDNSVIFKPKMAYQIFGESESIFGYRTISITLNYLHNSYECYVDIRSGGRIKDGNIEPDNVMNLLNEWLPANYTVSCEDFQEKFKEEKHDQMFGEVIEKFVHGKALEKFPDVTPTYLITKIDKVYLNKEFRTFHERFETFIIWYIESANFIDLEDEKWCIYYVYEKFEHPKTKATYCTPIGFCSVYKFYAYPDLIRPRISQFFILPSHQRRGIGSRMYKTIARDLRIMENVLDITVEDPTVEFKKIRDLDDCLLVQNEIDISSFFTMPLKEILRIGKEKKISKLQTIRVYDILGSVYSQRISKAAYKNFTERIRTRMLEESEKECRPGKRFCDLQRKAITLAMDKKAQIEAEFHRRLEELEPSIQHFHKHYRM